MLHTCSHSKGVQLLEHVKGLAHMLRSQQLWHWPVKMASNQ